jgi:HSP20 family protein
MAKTIHAPGLERVEIERLRSRVGRLFAALQEASEMFAPMAPGEWAPPVDLRESESEVTVSVEVPGVKAEHLEVALTGERLRVSGRKRKGTPRGAISHLCSERDYGRFTRLVRLHWPVRAAEATAELKDGLLTVRLPKLKERRGGEFKIQIKGNDE